MDVFVVPVLAGIDPVAVVSAATAGISAILGGWAVLQSRKTESKTQTREEIQQALDIQSGLLTRYEGQRTILEQKVSTLESKVEDAIAARAQAEQNHRECEERADALEIRVRTAEAQIAQLTKDKRHG